MINRVFVLSLALAVMWCGGAAAQSFDRPEAVARPPSKVSVVYVVDFEINAEQVAPQSSRFNGPVMSVLRGGPSALKAPEERAKDLKELMAKTITNTLIADGINAKRLTLGGPLPPEGWLIRGVFTKVDQGNRMQRATIGLGAGETHLTVIVTADDLNAGVPTPIQEIVAGAHSGKMLGAAPGAVIRFNPASAAAKFVMSGLDVEKNIIQTALKIANEISVHARKQ